MAFDDTKNEAFVLFVAASIPVGASLALHENGFTIGAWIGVALGVLLIAWGLWVGRPWFRRG